MPSTFEEWKIPITERPLRKIVLAATVDSINFDCESEAEKVELQCTSVDINDESDVPLMERRIDSKRMSVSTFDTETSMKGRAYPLTRTISQIVTTFLWGRSCVGLLGGGFMIYFHL